MLIQYELLLGEWADDLLGTGKWFGEILRDKMSLEKVILRPRVVIEGLSVALAVDQLVVGVFVNRTKLS